MHLNLSNRGLMIQRRLQSLLFLTVCLSSNRHAINNYCVLFSSFDSLDRPTELWCLWEVQLHYVSLKCCSERDTSPAVQTQLVTCWSQTSMMFLISSWSVPSMLTCNFKGHNCVYGYIGESQSSCQVCRANQLKVALSETCSLLV